jgi:hypothetical protein
MGKNNLIVLWLVVFASFCFFASPVDKIELGKAQIKTLKDKINGIEPLVNDEFAKIKKELGDDRFASYEAKKKDDLKGLLDASSVNKMINGKLQEHFDKTFSGLKIELKDEKTKAKFRALRDAVAKDLVEEKEISKQAELLTELGQEKTDKLLLAIQIKAIGFLLGKYERILKAAEAIKTDVLKKINDERKAAEIGKNIGKVGKVGKKETEEEEEAEETPEKTQEEKKEKPKAATGDPAARIRAAAYQIEKQYQELIEIKKNLLKKFRRRLVHIPELAEEEARLWQLRIDLQGRIGATKLREREEALAEFEEEVAKMKEDVTELKIKLEDKLHKMRKEDKEAGY